jgi:uncharacterized protein (TIGR02145 family)
MKVRLFIALILFTQISFTTDPKNHEKQDAGIFPEIKIGNQIWMAQNLQVSKFKNGDPIPEVKTIEEWQKALQEKQPAWLYYGDVPKKGVYEEEYGRLYNYYAVIDDRGLVPNSWRIATNDDWALYFQHMTEGSIYLKRQRIKKSFYGTSAKNNIQQSNWKNAKLPNMEGVFVSPCDLEDWLFESELVVLQDFYWYSRLNNETQKLEIPFTEMALAVRCIK